MSLNNTPKKPIFDQSANKNLKEEEEWSKFFTSSVRTANSKKPVTTGPSLDWSQNGKGKKESLKSDQTRQQAQADLNP